MKMGMVMRSAGVAAGRSDSEETFTRPLSLDLIRRLWTYTRSYRRLRNVLLGLVLLRSIQLALLGKTIGWVIDDTIANRDPVRLAWGVAGFCALALFTEVALHWRQLLALRLGEGVVHDLRRDLYAKLQHLTMDFYNRTKLGRIISRMTSDAEAVRIGIQNVLFVSLVNLGQMVMAAILMAMIDWRLFLVVLVVSPVMWAINRVFRSRLSRAFRNVQESFSRVTASVAESVNGIQVTQGFNREEENARRFADLVADHAYYNLVTARMKGLFLPLLDYNTQIFLAVLLLIGGYLTLHERAAAGDIVQFFFLANIFFAPIRTLGTQYTNALTAMAGAERVFAVLDQEPSWRDAPHAARPQQLRGHVVFDGVDFAYEPGKPVLCEIGFVAEPGQCIALVGSTGSGKTTVINLLAKFHLPDAGRLEIDGVDIRCIDTDALHRQLGIVLQSNFLFTGTVLDNIRIGKPKADLAEVRTAAEHLGCLDLLEALPDGFASQVGEGGSGLSLGQRQLVCFCRAMLADPRILILDEATSAVDTITEARIQEALEKLLRGRTSFVVAHRLSTIRHADLVLVLKEGRIVERGSHRELLARGGEYAAAYRRFLRGTE